MLTIMTLDNLRKSKWAQLHTTEVSLLRGCVQMGSKREGRSGWRRQENPVNFRHKYLGEHFHHPTHQICLFIGAVDRKLGKNPASQRKAFCSYMRFAFFRANPYFLGYAAVLLISIAGSCLTIQLCADSLIAPFLHPEWWRWRDALKNTVMHHFLAFKTLLSLCFKQTNNTTKLRQVWENLRRRQEVSKGFRHKCFTDVQQIKPQSLIKQTFSGSL